MAASFPNSMPQISRFSVLRIANDEQLAWQGEYTRFMNLAKEQ